MTPLLDATGLDAISAMFAAVQAQFPDHDFARTSEVDEHHFAARCEWALHTPDGTVALTGTDFVRISSDFRLADVVGFFGADDAPSASGRESIAHAACGLDVVGAELLAEVADVDLDDVRSGFEAVAPDHGQELFSGKDLAGMPEQDLGQRERARREFDRAAADAGRPSSEIEEAITCFEDRGLGAAFWSRSRARTRAKSSSKRKGLVT